MMGDGCIGVGCRTSGVGICDVPGHGAAATAQGTAAFKSRDQGFIAKT
jgi:hypothetical protein